MLDNLHTFSVVLWPDLPKKLHSHNNLFNLENHEFLTKVVKIVKIYVLSKFPKSKFVNYEIWSLGSGCVQGIDKKLASFTL